jgi:hypothetical protein
MKVNVNAQQKQKQMFTVLPHILLLVCIKKIQTTPTAYLSPLIVKIKIISFVKILYKTTLIN